MERAFKEKIDFVMTWVDGNDKTWQEQKLKYSNEKESDNRINAYRDWDLLRYWFRGVEKNASWVNKIYFVTSGQKPEWLNENNEKLVLINHKDYIPEEYLPTFSSHPIELNLHRIKGLSEKFSYFNDDVFIINKVKPSDFFIDGLPCDRAILNINCEKLSWQIQKINNNDIAVINESFDFKKCIKSYWHKWFNFKYGKEVLKNLWLYPCPRFPGIKHEHANSNFLKSTFDEVWEKHFEVLNETSRHKFREPNNDINQYLFKDWQIAEGKFIPSKKNSIFCDLKFRDNFGKYLKIIEKKKSKIVCINDADDLDENEYIDKKKKLIEAFNSILPEKSSFEK